ncbi:IS4 family transposase [uncultured Metabacillus sp.]|uniref:IS4 family transposase n=1 Tax=uncultured Metabacillus sp. TaxID=2860135 RepID=UPI0026204340|nr:IS4 family transposase [uncultured Metabacillus sp.]
MDKNNRKTTFCEYLYALDSRVISKMIETLKTDRYVKKLDSLKFLKLFIYAQLKQIESLTDISLDLKTNKKLQKEIGLKSISTATLSRKLGSISPDLFKAIFHHLVQKLHRHFGVKKSNEALGKIHLIDSSTISLALSKHRWADFRPTKAGVKLHLRVVFCEDVTYPDKLMVTPARPADVTQLDTLIVEEQGALHVFDRGYFDFEKFDEYCAKGIRFVTRLKENTVIQIIDEVPIEPDSSIMREAVVKIGKMKHPLRLVETRDTQGNLIRIVMNDAKISAEEISDLYRNRWQIELFFKWMKQHLVVKRIFGQSSQAVENQIFLAMITFCLTLLMKQTLSFDGSLWTLQKYLRMCWHLALSTLKRELFRKPTRKSKGRKKLDHERIFKETLLQYENQECEHLDDLKYDPIH